jgi:cobalt-zinc-cadmium resistance protein CzcA
MGGAVASQVLEGDRFFNLTVRLAPQYRNSVEAIGNIKVGYQTSSGANAYIPLRELAAISLDTGPAYIYHEAMDRDIPVKFSVRGRDLGSEAVVGSKKFGNWRSACSRARTGGRAGSQPGNTQRHC